MRWLSLLALPAFASAVIDRWYASYQLNLNLNLNGTIKEVPLFGSQLQGAVRRYLHQNAPPPLDQSWLVISLHPELQMGIAQVINLFIDWWLAMSMIENSNCIFICKFAPIVHDILKLQTTRQGESFCSVGKLIIGIICPKRVRFSGIHFVRFFYFIWSYGIFEILRTKVYFFIQKNHNVSFDKSKTQCLFDLICSHSRIFVGPIMFEGYSFCLQCHLMNARSAQVC